MCAPCVHCCSKWRCSCSTWLHVTTRGTRPPLRLPAHAAATYWYTDVFGASAAKQNATVFPPELDFLALRGVTKDGAYIPRSIAVGYDGQFALAFPNGSAYAWHRPPPAAASAARPWFSALPWLVGARVRQVAVGASVGVALLSNGSVRAWRYGERGPQPLEVPSRVQSSVVNVSCAADEQAALVVAVRSNGRMVAWRYGASWAPELLFWDTEQGPDVFGRVSERGAVKVVVGQHARLALLADGSVVTWAPGGDPYGQTQVPAEAQGKDIMDVGAGVGHFVALRQDGRLVAWGLNADGQAAVPREQGRGFYSLAAGWRHTLAISNNGSQLFAVGRKGVALVPADLTRVVGVAAGSNQSIAIGTGLFE